LSILDARSLSLVLDRQSRKEGFVGEADSPLERKLVAIEAWIAAIRARDVRAARLAVTQGRRACIAGKEDPFAGLFAWLGEVAGRLPREDALKTPTADKDCSFCGTPGDAPEIKILIEGPSARICDRCASLGRTEISTAAALTAGTCSFCSKQEAGIYTRRGIDICVECLGLCADIVADYELTKAVWG
jgi:hypothetical protein